MPVQASGTHSEPHTQSPCEGARAHKISDSASMDRVGNVADSGSVGASTGGVVVVASTTGGGAKGNGTGCDVAGDGVVGAVDGVDGADDGVDAAVVVLAVAVAGVDGVDAAGADDEHG